MLRRATFIKVIQIKTVLLNVKIDFPVYLMQSVLLLLDLPRRAL
jgi:hypothetical protein